MIVSKVVVLVLLVASRSIIVVNSLSLKLRAEVLVDVNSDRASHESNFYRSRDSTAANVHSRPQRIHSESRCNDGVLNVSLFESFQRLSRRLLARSFGDRRRNARVAADDANASLDGIDVQVGRSLSVFAVSPQSAQQNSPVGRDDLHLQGLNNREISMAVEANRTSAHNVNIANSNSRFSNLHPDQQHELDAEESSMNSSTDGTNSLDNSETMSELTVSSSDGGAENVAIPPAANNQNEPIVDRSVANQAASQGESPRAEPAYLFEVAPEADDPDHRNSITQNMLNQAFWSFLTPTFQMVHVAPVSLSLQTFVRVRNPRYENTADEQESDNIQLNMLNVVVDSDAFDHGPMARLCRLWTIGWSLAVIWAGVLMAAFTFVLWSIRDDMTVIEALLLWWSVAAAAAAFVFCWTRHEMDNGYVEEF